MHVVEVNHKLANVRVVTYFKIMHAAYYNVTVEYTTILICTFLVVFFLNEIALTKSLMIFTSCQVGT